MPRGTSDRRTRSYMQAMTGALTLADAVGRICP
jgi:hypothetical protein